MAILAQLAFVALRTEAGFVCTINTGAVSYRLAAPDGWDGGIVDYTGTTWTTPPNPEYVIITGVSIASGYSDLDVQIPRTLPWDQGGETGYIGASPVRYIADNAFKGLSAIRKITVPNTVVSIGRYAFAECPNLESATVNGSDATMGAYAFQKCPKLKTAFLGDGIRTLGEYSFYLCTSLESVRLPSFIAEIPQYCFRTCSSLASIEIPNTVQTIGYEAFCWSGLVSVTVPEGAKTIGKYAFNNCSNLVSATLPNSLTSIGQSALGYCPSLEYLTLPFPGTAPNENSAIWVLGYPPEKQGGRITKSGAYTSGTNLQVTITGGTYPNQQVCTGDFSKFDSLKSISLPECVADIDVRAFYYCCNLESVRLPEGVVTIGSHAFMDCRNLVDISIPKSVRSIGDYAFAGTRISSVEIPHGVTGIGERTFYACTNLVSVSLPNSVTNIGQEAFSYCYGLHSVFIPDSVESLEAYAFRDCGLYAEPTLGVPSFTVFGAEGLAQTDQTAFHCGGGGFAVTVCTWKGTSTSFNPSSPGGNRYAYFPERLRTLPPDNSVSNNCCLVYYPEIPIQDAASALPSGEFGLEYAVRMVFGDSDTATDWIADGLPQGLRVGACGMITGSPLETGTFNVSLSAMTGDAVVATRGFSLHVAPTENIEIVDGLPWLYEIQDGEAILAPKRLPNGQIRRTLPLSTLGAVALPQTLGGCPVAAVAEEAMCGLAGVTFLSIPNNIVRLGPYNYSFSRMVNLREVSLACNPTNRFYPYYNDFRYCPSLEKVVFEHGVTSVWDYAFSDSYSPRYAITSLKTVILSDSVTSIGRYAFGGCSALTSVTIPNSVTSIGYGAFSYCSALASVTIPNSVKVIAESAFQGSGLTSVELPDSITTINRYVFMYCDDLADVFIPNTVTNIGYEAFRDCQSLASIEIPDSVTSIEREAFYGCSGLTSVTIPNSVTSIGDGAFRDCTGLTSVTIPDSVTSINGAFRDCSSLTSVAIPNSVTSIYGAFQGCGSLTSVAIPDSVTSIDYAFHGCGGLTSVTIPDSVTSIGTYAFAGCYRLTSITIPNSVTSIGYGALLNCSGLTSVTIPSSVTSIGYRAFWYCSSLTSLDIPDSVTSIGYEAFQYCSNLQTLTLPAAFEGKTGSLGIPSGCTVVFREAPSEPDEPVEPEPRIATITAVTVVYGDQAYGPSNVGEYILLAVEFSDEIESVSGSPLLMLNVQNQNNNPNYYLLENPANNTCANYAVYDSHNGNWMIFKYRIKPGDYADDLDAQSFVIFGADVAFEGCGSFDLSLPTGSEAGSLASNSDVLVQTIAFDLGDCTPSVTALDMAEGESLDLTVTRDGGRGRWGTTTQDFIVSSEDANGNPMASGEVISYPASFSIQGRSATLTVAAEWAGTQILRLHPVGYSGTDGDLLATFTVSGSSPEVLISAPDSAVEGGAAIIAQVSLSKAPREATTVTVSSSNPDGLAIAGSAVLTFQAGQTGPRDVLLRPLDGGDGPLTISADADKTYSSASHSIWVSNAAPTTTLPLDEDGVWELSGIVARLESTFTFRVSDAAADLAAGISATVDFGDGTWTNIVCGANGIALARHTYSSAGTFAFSLTLRDKDGGSSSYMGRAVVEPPCVALIQEYKRPEGNVGRNIYRSAAGEAMEGMGEGSVLCASGGERVSVTPYCDWQQYFAPQQRSAIFIGQPEDFTDLHPATGEEAVFNSFFHVWVGDDFTSYWATNSVAHLQAASVTIGEDAEGFLVGGVFAREHYPEDNCADIDADGLPDIWEELVWPDELAFEDVGGTAGRPYGRDDNPDGDFLPACVVGIAGDGSFIVSGNDYSPCGIPFSNAYEVRGTHWGLNAAMSGAAGPRDEPRQGSYDAQTFEFTDTDSREFFGTDPAKADTDNDGLTDGWEYFFWRQAKFADAPIGVRRIGDGPETPIDNAEIVAMFNPCVPNDHRSLDIDGDGLSNYEEFLLGTSPVLWDSIADLPLGARLAAVLDNALDWTTGGDAQWSMADDAVAVGGTCARSGATGDTESSWIETSVNGPGTISFRWKASSQARLDRLTFSVDGEAKSFIAGTAASVTNWAECSFDIEGGGPHALRWTYAKSPSGTAGEDCGWLDNVSWSPSASSMIEIPEALDAPNLEWTSGGNDSDAWEAVASPSFDGEDACAAFAKGADGVARIATEVEGPGTISFRWRVEGGTSFAGIAFMVDGEDVEYCENDSWALFEHTVSGKGAHTIAWEYFWDGEPTGDAGFLDCVSWTPAEDAAAESVTVEGVAIPHSWLSDEAATILATNGGDYEATANATAANGVNKVWECYVAGLNPTNATDVFRAVISIDTDGEPIVGWEPDLNEGGTKHERVYTVEGKENLTDSWAPTNSASRFFRVKVSMP